MNGRALDALKKLVRNTQDVSLANRLSREAIGPSPPIGVVYRDRGLPGDGIGDLDVVRISGAAHTYVIVFEPPRLPIALDNQPVCIAGDARCSSYDIWL